MSFQEKIKHVTLKHFDIGLNISKRCYLNNNKYEKDLQLE